MRAVMCKDYGRLSDLVLEEAPDPTPGEGQVLVDVRAAGLNFPDLLIAQGKYQARPELPFVLGGEGSGLVAAVGPGVKRPKVGDRIIAMELTGAFAEKWVVPATSTIPVPEGVSFEAAAGIAITYGTSYYALKQRAGLQEGETLLVLGAAGGVGLAAVELGKAMGARVIAAASTDEKLEVARAAGADEGINYSTEDLKSRIKALTGKKGADVSYDPVGGEYSEAALRGIAWNGRFLVIGFAAGDIPKIPLNLALLKGCSIVGVFWGSWLGKDPRASAENFGELSRWLSDGTLEPKVTTYPLERFAEGIAELAERRATGKIVLTMGG